MVQGPAAGRVSGRGNVFRSEDEWMVDPLNLILSLEDVRITILNLPKEAVYSLWKTQSYRNASLNFPWIGLPNLTLL